MSQSYKVLGRVGGGVKGKGEQRVIARPPAHVGVKEVSNQKEGAFLGGWFPTPGSFTVP